LSLPHRQAAHLRFGL